MCVYMCVCVCVCVCVCDDLGIESAPPALADGFFTTKPPVKPTVLG